MTNSQPVSPVCPNPLHAHVMLKHTSDIVSVPSHTSASSSRPAMSITDGIITHTEKSILSHKIEFQMCRWLLLRYCQDVSGTCCDSIWCFQFVFYPPVCPPSPRVSPLPFPGGNLTFCRSVPHSRGLCDYPRGFAEHATLPPCPPHFLKTKITPGELNRGRLDLG